jgi:hypothetical protein
VAASIARGEGLVWRVASDRVVVRRVGSSHAIELLGPTALVWAALDEPQTVAALASWPRRPGGCWPTCWRR